MKKTVIATTIALLTLAGASWWYWCQQGHSSFKHKDTRQLHQVTIYTKPTCPYCIKAKKLLESYKVHYKEISIAGRPQLREEMIEKSQGRTTVPQIFIAQVPIGGFSELKTLHQDGNLSKLLLLSSP